MKIATIPPFDYWYSMEKHGLMVNGILVRCESDYLAVEHDFYAQEVRKGIWIHLDPIEIFMYDILVT